MAEEKPAQPLFPLHQSLIQSTGDAVSTQQNENSEAEVGFSFIPSSVPGPARKVVASSAAKFEDAARTKRSRKDSHSSSDTQGHKDKRKKSPPPIRKPPAVSTKPWIIDAVGDQENVTYGSIYASSIPNYERAYGSTCIATDGTTRVHFNDRRDSRDTRPDYNMSRNSRYFSKRALKAEYAADRRVLRIISTAKPQRRQAKDRWDSLKKVENVQRRFIPLAKTEDTDKQPQKPIEEDTPPDPSAGENFEERMRRRTKEFNQQLRERPDDVATWRAYIRFQDESIGEAASRKSQLLISEKKLSIYEKAIQSNPNNESLLIEYLEECRTTGDPEKLESKWRQIIFNHPSSTALWGSYLNFITSELSRFSFPAALGQYHKCIDTIQALQSGSFQSHQLKMEECEESLITMAQRSCHFQKRAGFMEKAVSCFQAVIEFACFTPDEFAPKSSSINRQIACFETFWDSGAARIGEENAQGFNRWLETRKMGGGQETLAAVINNPPIDPPASLLSDKTSRAEKWYAIETYRETTHWLPWRPDEAKGETEDDCEDLDRVVMFDDVAGHLFRIHTDGSLKVEIVLRFLEFLGLSLPARYSSNHTHSRDSVMRLESLGEMMVPITKAAAAVSFQQKGPIPEVDYVVEKSSVVQGVEGGRSFGHVHVANPGSLWGPEVPPPPTTQVTGRYESDLREECLVGAPRGWAPHPQIKNKTKRAFITRVFQQSLQRFKNNTSLMTCYIQFIAEESLKSAKKLAKTFMMEPENRNNVDLLHTYAQLEIASGKPKGMRKVYNTVLTMAGSAAEQERGFHVFRECHHYIQAELKLGDENAALNIIVSFANGSPITPDSVPTAPSIIKARKVLNTLMANLTSPQPQGEEGAKWIVRTMTTSNIISAVSVAAWFEYLTSSYKKATVIFDSALQTIAKVHEQQRKLKPQAKSRWDERADLIPKMGDVAFGALQHELLSTYYLQLLHYHARRHPYSPTTVREGVEKVLEIFPNNPEINAVYILGEAKSRIAGRLRRHYLRQLRPSNQHGEGGGSGAGPAVALFALYSELTQEIPGAVNRVRGVFERAVLGPWRSCVLLWRLFLSFECVQERGRRSETILYRALQVCPDAKVVFMDGVYHIPAGFNELLDIFQEKELHLRTPIEEVDLEEEEEEEEEQQQQQEDEQEN